MPPFGVHMSTLAGAEAPVSSLQEDHGGQSDVVRSSREGGAGIGVMRGSATQPQGEP